MPERTRPRAIFFGTPAFAVTCLDALVEVADVVCAIAQPDKPKGRGLTLTSPPVKTRAVELGIPTLAPTRLKDPELHSTLRGFEADVAVVVAYGRILPQAILDVPRRGCINVHASLLPRWRGAAPIQWAIRAGDTETGVCLMEMEAGLDTGPVFACTRTSIEPNETGGELFVRLAPLGADLVRRQLLPWLEGELRARPQDASQVTIARMLTKEDAELDFTLPAVAVHDQARSMMPWPGAFARIDGPKGVERLAIHGTRLVDPSRRAAEPGTVLGLGPLGLEVACALGVVALTELQQEGKKRLPAKVFASGRAMTSFRRKEAR